jgi:DNA-binding transcriptional regulator YdaS (Cro superfamily)
VTRNLDMATEAWGGAPPAWVRALARACDETSQQKVAKRVGVSGSCVNQVLKRVYKGRYDRVETKVRGAILGDTVDCPALLVALPVNLCLENQARDYDSSNHLTVRLARTCPVCPHRTRPAEGGGDVAQ